MDVQFPVTFRTGEHYRVDKSYIWLGPVVATFLVVFFGALTNLDGLIRLFKAAQNGWIPLSVPIVILIALGVVLVLFVILLLMYVLAYKHMSFVFYEHEFSFYSGIFVKKRVHLPYERVQSVNHNASVIQRIAGVCTVIVDSAGGSSNKSVRVPYVRLHTAECIRSDLFVRKAASHADAQVEYVGEEMAAKIAEGGQVVGSSSSNILDDTIGVIGEWRGVFGGETYAAEPVEFEFGLTNKQLALASFTHSGSIIGGFVTFLCMIFTVASLFFVNQFVPALLLSLSFPIVIGATLVVWIAASVGIMLGYGNFKVRRCGTRVEVERGLLARHFTGIDITRIQSIEMRQSFFRRLIGHCELSLGRIDHHDGEDSTNHNTATHGLVIHPFLPIDQAHEIVRELLPEFDGRPRLQDCDLLPKVAERRAILRRCLWFNWTLWGGLLCIAVLLVLSNVAYHSVLADQNAWSYFAMFTLVSAIVIAVIIVVSTVVYGIGAVLWARNSKYGWNRNFLLVHNDGITTSTSVIPRKKIQSGNSRSNPLQRRCGVASIVAVTAAGTSKTEVRLVDVSRKDVIRYLEWLQ